MSTQYMVAEQEGTENCIQLDERSGQYDLDLYVEALPEILTIRHRMTAEQVVEIAAKLIGPLFYQYPDGKFVELLELKLKEGGYTV